jgi:hypothetical protein
MALLQVAPVSIPPHCLSIMLALSIVGNWNVQFWGSPQWHKVHTKFHPDLSSDSRAKSCGQADMTSLICINFMRNMQIMHKKGRFLKINGPTSIWIMNYAHELKWNNSYDEQKKYIGLFWKFKGPLQNVLPLTWVWPVQVHFNIWWTLHCCKQHTLWRKQAKYNDSVTYLPQQ